MRAKTRAMKSYIRLRRELLYFRRKNNNYYSEGEDIILEKMDLAWCKLSRKEIEELRKQGSWKFKKGKNV
jgi:hypothetical protein